MGGKDLNRVHGQRGSRATRERRGEGAHSPLCRSGQPSPPTSKTGRRDRPRGRRRRRLRTRRTVSEDATSRTRPVGRDVRKSAGGCERKARRSSALQPSSSLGPFKSPGGQRAERRGLLGATSAYLRRLDEMRLDHLAHSAGAEPGACLVVSAVPRRRRRDVRFPAGHDVSSHPVRVQVCLLNNTINRPGVLPRQMFSKRRAPEPSSPRSPPAFTSSCPSPVPAHDPDGTPRPPRVSATEALKASPSHTWHTSCTPPRGFRLASTFQAFQQRLIVGHLMMNDRGAHISTSTSTRGRPDKQGRKYSSRNAKNLKSKWPKI